MRYVMSICRALRQRIKDEHICWWVGAVRVGDLQCAASLAAQQPQRALWLLLLLLLLLPLLPLLPLLLLSSAPADVDELWPGPGAVSGGCRAVMYLGTASGNGAESRDVPRGCIVAL
jgi:hypothetical protein